MKHLRSELTAFLCLSFFLISVYWSNRDFTLSGDAEASTLLAKSVVTQGNLTFTPYEAPHLFFWEIDTKDGTRQLQINRWAGAIEGVPLNEHYQRGRLRAIKPLYNVFPTIRHDASTQERLYINTFGIGAALTATPVFLSVRLWRSDSLDNAFILNMAGKLAASLAVALSGGIVYLSLRRWLALRASILLAVLYGLGTGVWSTSSQALWQHGPNEFWLALGMASLCYLDKQNASRNGFLSGLAFAFAALCRPTSLLFLPAVGAYLFRKERYAGLAFTLGAAPLLLGLMSYNSYYLGSPFSSAQMEVSKQLALIGTGSENVWSTPLWLGLPGLLLSPAHGVFVYSPFIVFSCIGAIKLWEDPHKQYAVLLPLLGASLLIFLIQAKWYDWHGGLCYGNRPLADISAILVLLIAPAWLWIKHRSTRFTAFGVLAVLAILIQFVGAFAFDGSWHFRKQNGTELAVTKPEYKYRYWSLSDNPISYYATHFAQGRRNRRVMMGLAD